MTMHLVCRKVHVLSKQTINPDVYHFVINFKFMSIEKDTLLNNYQ